jgi:nicotinamide mononucleotide (NMN) deamidase PncC
MPTFKHGKNAVFLMTGSSTGAFDFTNVVTDVALSKVMETGETTAFSNLNKTFIVGLQDATISVSGYYDPTADENINGAIARLSNGTVSSLSFSVGPSGSSAGTDIKYSGACIITSYDLSPAVADVVPFTLELQVTGSVTRSTW